MKSLNITQNLFLNLALLLFAQVAGLRAAEPAPTATPIQIPQRQRTPGKLEAKIAPYKGRIVLMVNGQPVAPQMYSGTEHSRQTWTDLPRQSIEEFTAQGYQIIQSDFWLKYSLRPDGTLDVEGIRRQLAGICSMMRWRCIRRCFVSTPIVIHPDPVFTSA